MPSLYGSDGPITGAPSAAVLQGGIAQPPPPPSHLPDAVKELGLSPQEQFLYQFHLNNLNGPGKVMQPNGQVSTLLQMAVRGPAGKFYNIPSVWGGQVLPEEQAKARAAAVGWDKWPAYSSAKAADARYQKMHEFIDRDGADYQERAK